MSRRLAIVGDWDAAALAGFDGGLRGADAHTAPPEASPEADWVVLLGEAALPDGAPRERTVRWLRGEAAPGGQDVPAIGQHPGQGWRCAPWPARDELFELQPPTAGQLAVVHGDADRAEFVARIGRERGLPAAAAKRLTLGLLETAAVVLLPTARPEPLPADAPAVLAAGRVLVTGPCEPAFGLLAELDWFPGEREDDMLAYADAALRRPFAFAVPRALGRLAAERHRASTVYARLVAELELGA